MRIRMSNICVVTATRAEYGLLHPLIKRMKDDPDIAVSIVATGSHLSPEFGLTYKEIEKDGFIIDRKIEILMSGDSPTAISKTMSLALSGFADYFKERTFDAVVLLGDRYEILAIACAAMNAHIPIIHLYGGEVTEGAMDDSIRHAISKLSWLHFTSTESYRKNVIQMGESPDRVFRSGSLGVENALNVPLMTREELAESIDFLDIRDHNYAVVTFHSVTLEDNTAEEETLQMLNAFSDFLRLHSEMRFIITGANADANGRIINQLLRGYCEDTYVAQFYDSLGMKRYLSALKYACMVIGNSSSGIMEAPSFHIPTVNIGDRQKGRIRAESVIDCLPAKEAIENSMTEAYSNMGLGMYKNINNPYGAGCPKTN